jgi:hypothetical protein
MDRKDLQSLSRWRLLEARALLRAGLPNGAYYLAGYSIECALKACIAKTSGGKLAGMRSTPSLRLKS